MTKFRLTYFSLIATSIVVLTAICLMAGLAVGFLVPLVIAAAACGLVFYWVLRHQGVRNPLAPMDRGLSGRWADGQPLTRSVQHEKEAETMEEQIRSEQAENAERSRRYKDERDEVQRHVPPGDFHGPPPEVPFP